LGLTPGSIKALEAEQASDTRHNYRSADLPDRAPNRLCLSFSTGMPILIADAG